MGDAPPQEFVFPRVLGSALPQYLDNTVILVGKMDPVRQGPFSILECSDGVKVRVVSQEDSVYTSAYQEIVGAICSPDPADGDQTPFVQEFMSRDIGDSMHTENYNKMVNLINGKFKFIYYGRSSQGAQA